MSNHIATVAWARQPHEPFVDNKYSRAHTWRFDGGAEVLGSPSPQVVKPPLSDPAGVDPEEAFIASISSCHMLWFLDLAARRKWIVESYEDEAVGTLARNADKKMMITRVVLRPRIVFAPDATPDPATLDALHHEAHDKCFIASSVKTEIVIETR